MIDCGLTLLDANIYKYWGMHIPERIPRRDETLRPGKALRQQSDHPHPRIGPTLVRLYIKNGRNWQTNVASFFEFCRKSSTLASKDFLSVMLRSEYLIFLTSKDTKSPF